MKPSYIFLASALLCAAHGVQAQQIAGGQITVQNSSVSKSGSEVSVSMDLDLGSLDLKSNEGVVLTPMLVSRGDTARMPAVEILGRKRYIYYQRNGTTATTAPAVVERRVNGTEQQVHYSATLPARPWMNRSSLIMAEGLCECAQTLIGTDAHERVAGVNLDSECRLQYAYVQPQAEAVKQRAEEGSARLNFAVGKHDIRPTFGSNADELQKIRSTIDLVRNDKDVELTGISLHGYASPDGTYAFNEKLAANRTEALRTYLKNYYSALSDGLFTATSTAEDWEGVRRAVASGSIADKEAVLAIIDGSGTPDEKDRAIAARHAGAYQTLLKDIYPPLRRTDYKVTYNVRSFNLDEARRIIKERPQKLSLQEMYLVANSYDKGSEDFRQVFDVAVRMFPDDELANLNAANVALERGDATSAERYLPKAGTSAEAVNARGILAVKKGDYAAARTLFRQAAQSGLAEAKANLQELDELGL